MWFNSDIYQPLENIRQVVKWFYLKQICIEETIHGFVTAACWPIGKWTSGASQERLFWSTRSPDKPCVEGCGAVGFSSSLQVGFLMGVTTNYPKWFIWVNLRVENAFKDGHFDRGMKPIFNGENAGFGVHTFQETPNWTCFEMDRIDEWLMVSGYIVMFYSYGRGYLIQSTGLIGVYRPLKRGHIHRCVCNIHISCVWNSTANSIFLVEKHGKTICFELPYSKIKWIWKLFPASNTPWPYWGWLDWRFIRTASELRIFGAVGFSWVFHMFFLGFFFLGFPWIFLGFPYVGVSSSSPGEASRDCCGQGVRNGGYPTIGWLRGCSWGYYMVIVCYSHSGYQRMVIPCYTIVSYWAYSWFLPISGGYSMSYCNYSNNPYKSGENPPDCSCIPTYFTGTAPSRDWEGHHFKK